MKSIKYLLLSVVLLASACRKDAPELMNPNESRMTSTPSQVFETFWRAMNNTYVFWDIDPTDWDKIHDDYLPRFRELDALETVETEKLQELYTEICENLVDHHFSLAIINDKAPEDAETRQITVQPGIDEAMSRDYFHLYFSWEAFWSCIAKYKSAGRISDFAEGQNKDMYACSYNIDGGIIYFHLSGFAISDAKPDDPEDTVMEAVDNYLRLIQETPEIKGVILDVRGNGGGYLADMQYTIAPLIDEELLIGYTRVKEGLGRLDYAPWIPSTLTPAARHRKVEDPVVALTDILSYSMAEMTAMAVSELPGGCVIGERTLGATGPLMSNYAFTYSGQVNNPYMTIYTSTAVMKDAKGVNHEGVGVTPDIEVFYDEAAMESGTDVQLDRAIEYIHTGR